MRGGETEEGALRRYVKENLNIEVKILKLLAQGVSSEKTVTWYECEPLTPDVRANNDLEYYLWIPYSYVAKYCGEATKEWPKEIHEYFKV